MNIRLYGRVRESIVDGPGVRYAIFVQGCPRRCRGCHNIESQPFEGGEIVDTDDIISDVLAHMEILSGITLSGGEPFSQARALAEVARAARRKGLTVWTYTGYTLDEIKEGGDSENCWGELLEETDVLVDGPFEMDRRTLSVPFIGSDNQRIIYLRPI